MTLTRDVPFYLNHVPLHRMNQVLTAVWMLGERHEARRQLVRSLSKRYRSGVGVCSATLYLIAYIAGEKVRELLPPFQRFEMWQMNNRPAPPECPCAAFIDLENGGAPWRERGRPEQHHPLCQWEKSAKDVFVRYAEKQDSEPGKVRPDDLTRLRDEITGR